MIRENLADIKRRASVDLISGASRYVVVSQAHRVLDQDVPRLVAALTAVLDEHEEDGNGSCRRCGDWSEDPEKANPTAYPCATVQAITAALETRSDTAPREGGSS